MTDNAPQSPAPVWPQEKIFEAIRGILVDSLGVKEEEVVAEAALVDDLSAESIDFLDIGFKVQQTFGVRLPVKDLQGWTATWGTRIVNQVCQILETKYGVTVPDEERKQFHGQGLKVILTRMAGQGGDRAAGAEVGTIGQELVARLTRDLVGFGFEVTMAQQERFVDLMLTDLTSPQIAQEIRRMFTVRALVNYIGGNLAGGREQPATA